MELLFKLWGEIMDRLTLKLESGLNNEIKDYLMQLDGINDVDVDLEKDIIHLLYDSFVISINVILKEIKLFLNIYNTSSVIEFDKHYDNGVNEYVININDLCCEYCLMGIIEELVMVNGIVSANSDYDNINKENVKVLLCYDKDIISKEELIRLENKINC